ncbi:hypothetical protein B9G69_009160 [Bdellovibrio sp. SKB1291214]|uniref:hypothetical protein n=1 Tax=Bdellovibrio sp. SKB1291214 TaxID=1732569 RepID=UPI000B51A77F|nr:hypothetical protein [Bdellovibrio sp. SKB1291214]UYL07215.1 hypothetical protein B9G69_009160 [Bdellovibrio sp. SKB1291214]
MLQRHSLITAALIATLGLTACSKDKTAGPQGQPQEPAATGEVMSDTPNPAEGTNVNPSSPSSSDYEIKNGVIIGKKGGGVANGPYVDNNPANIESSKYGKRLTGARSNEGLLYTSSASDDTLDVLRGLKRDQFGLSASVTDAKLKFDSISGQSVITLSVQENGFPRIYNLVGDSSMDNENQIVRLRAARGGNGTNTTGSMPINGTLQCLDLDGGCQTTLVKVDLGFSGSASHIDIVFRQSVADLHFVLPEHGSGNPEYDVMEELALNTYKYKQGDNRVKTSYMHSWEVANGRAGFSVVLRTYTNELLAYSGPLVSPESGNTTNIVLKPLKKDPTQDDDGISNGGKLGLQNMIGEARLTANNGLGQLRIVFKMRKLARHKQDVFAIVFMRRSKPVIDLNDSQEQTPPPTVGTIGGDDDGGGYGDGGDDLPSVE